MTETTLLISLTNSILTTENNYIGNLSCSLMNVFMIGQQWNPLFWQLKQMNIIEIERRLLFKCYKFKHCCQLTRCSRCLCS